MRFKESIRNDLDGILQADEVSDDVVLGSGESAISGKAVINVNGQSDNEWAGGSVIYATALLPKNTFTTEPKPHETLTVTNGRTYRVVALTNESSSSWIVSIVADNKIKA